MIADDIAAIREREQHTRATQACRIAVCSTAGCLSTGGAAVKEALVGAVKAAGLDPSVRVMGTGCLGLCHAGPLMRVEMADATPVIFSRMAPAFAKTVVDGVSSGRLPLEQRCNLDQPFFTRQQRIVTADAGEVDAERIEDYLAVGGYSALERVLAEMRPDDVIKEVAASGLRGRGGAGYPTGLKWSTVAKAAGPGKFVVCNADEGDPGAFMDRSVLEGDPHRVLEGMAIAAFAVGAEQGFIYVRGEYPLAINRLKTAIRQAERMQLLGHRILDTQFNFRIDLRMGAGAFVCGEETALLASIEGKRGSPRPRPPFPAESGLWGKPTLINNVETFANIAPIIRHGGAHYAELGTERSKGTKVFALAGRIVNTGLVEVPMGMPLRDIIFDIGGGIPNGRTFKAAQTGGPSGGCIPAAHLDLPVDYEALSGIGSIMGSGGLIVMDDTSCMVDVARYFMEFCRDESCGKCIPCRAGTVQMHELLLKMTHGTATERDLALLEQLAELVTRTSLCGLGQTAANPVMSTLRHFRDEYMAHIHDRVCPAGVCAMGTEEPR
jgi:bidirectional [NiFe] hydrogenase diaphorase subunit